MNAFSARFPLGRPAVLAPFALAGAAVLATALMKDMATGQVPAAPVVQTRAVVFQDAPHGAVRVDDVNGAAITAFASGEGAFVRGVLRTFARERRAGAVGPDAPFQLARHADGRVSLTDTSNGQMVVLDAFGPTNAAAFAALLTSGKE